MFNFIKLSTLFTLLIAVSSAVQAPPVWKVTKGDAHIFVGGTVHLLSEADYPLPNAFQQAYEKSDKLIFETDMAAMSDPAFQQKTMQLMTFTDGTTLSDVLSQETLEALDKHLTARNIPLQNMMIFKPSLLYVTLSVIELQAIGLNAQGVDQYFSNLAMKDNKKQGWLETPEEQLNFLLKLGKGDPDELIAYTLKDLKKLPQIMGELKSAWRQGDMKALTNVGIDPIQQDFPELYQDLLVTRNNNWIPQMEAYFASEEIEFVLVGALHLAGDDSVLKTLETKGYKVEKL